LPGDVDLAPNISRLFQRIADHPISLSAIRIAAIHAFFQRRLSTAFMSEIPELDRPYPCLAVASKLRLSLAGSTTIVIVEFQGVKTPKTLPYSLVSSSAQPIHRYKQGLYCWHDRTIARAPHRACF
jgi:hypothetical protein